MGIFSDIYENNFDKFGDEIYSGDRFLSRYNLNDSYASANELYKRTYHIYAPTQEISHSEKKSYSKKKLNEIFSSLCLSRDRCRFRERFLFSIRNENDFKSFIVKNFIKEYLSMLDNQIDDMRIQIKEISSKIDKIVENDQKIDEKLEKDLTLKTLISAAFIFINENDTVIEPHCISEIFSDIALLIKYLKDKEDKKSAKEICKEFYLSEKNAVVSREVCENCGEKMVKGFNYCFNCYEKRVENGR